MRKSSRPNDQDSDWVGPFKGPRGFFYAPVQPLPTEYMQKQKNVEGNANANKEIAQMQTDISDSEQQSKSRKRKVKDGYLQSPSFRQNHPDSSSTKIGGKTNSSPIFTPNIGTAHPGIFNMNSAQNPASNPSPHFRVEYTPYPSCSNFAPSVALRLANPTPYSAPNRVQYFTTDRVLGPSGPSTPTTMQIPTIGFPRQEGPDDKVEDVQAQEYDENHESSDYRSIELAEQGRVLQDAHFADFEAYVEEDDNEASCQRIERWVEGTFAAKSEWHSPYPPGGHPSTLV